MSDLRNHLFAALEALADKDNPLEIERAKAIAQVAGVVIESAKVEVKYLEVTGQEECGEFFPSLAAKARPDRARLRLTRGDEIEQ